jgi:hypothetical protein
MPLACGTDPGLRSDRDQSPLEGAAFKGGVAMVDRDHRAPLHLSPWSADNLAESASFGVPRSINHRRPRMTGRRSVRQVRGVSVKGDESARLGDPRQLAQWLPPNSAFRGTLRSASVLALAPVLRQSRRQCSFSVLESLVSWPGSDGEDADNCFRARTAPFSCIGMRLVVLPLEASDLT